MAQWRDIHGYEGLYQVSDAGEVKSLSNGKYKKEKILKPGIRGRKNSVNNGYLFVVLSKDFKPEKHSVHRLVATAFLENPLELDEVNHINGVTIDNRLNNLEWCNRQYNIDYSKSKRIAQYDLCGNKISEYKGIKRASIITGISRTAINNVLRGWSNTSGGYIWKYE